MHASWNTLAATLCAALTITAANAAEFALSSQSDFSEISLNIKDTYNANPDLITLDVTLNQDAQQRMAAASSAALGQDLTLLVNGQAVSTSRVQNTVDAPQLQIPMSRQAAMELLPTLLNANAGAGAPAAPLATTRPAPGANAPGLLVAAPAMVETQPVMPPSVSDSSIEARTIPVPAAQQLEATPAVPPDLAPVAAADPALIATTAATAEPAMAPADAAPPESPSLAMPRWALGAWLPTSATPSPYAEINVGDPVAIYANAVDAITCNRAKLAVLESSSIRIRLQLAPNSQCVISGVPVDRLQISPTETPGKIVISLYAQQDDFNGAPSKEGYYRRK